jgi:hypothetical protein
MFIQISRSKLHGVSWQKLSKAKKSAVYFAELPKDACEWHRRFSRKRSSGKRLAAARAKTGREIIERARAFGEKTESRATNFELARTAYITRRQWGVINLFALEILAETQTENGKNYGRLLRWKDSKNRPASVGNADRARARRRFGLIKRLTGEGLEVRPTADIGKSSPFTSPLQNPIRQSSARIKSAGTGLGVCFA